MSGLTPRFALNFFGGDTPGTIDDDNQKFTGEDRLVEDRILAGLEKHDHHLQAPLEDPDAMPELELVTGAGNLQAGTEYFYLLSIVNADGLETAAGPEESISTPDLLGIPDAPQAYSGQDGGNTGSLTPGLYLYALSGLRGSEETPLSDLVQITLLDGDTAVGLQLPAKGDAERFQVWRMKDSDAGWTRVLQTNPADNAVLDDGSVPSGVYGDPANVPPSMNTGVGNYSIKVSLGTDDEPKIAKAHGWRIYRSDVSGTYGATSLVHEVVEREDELDPSSALLTSWIDVGDATLTGSPKPVSQELAVTPYTFDGGDTPPSDFAPYPNNYPYFSADDGILYVRRPSGWTAVTGGGGGALRGVAIFTGVGDPTPEPAGAVAGDIYIDVSSYDLWVLEGPSHGGGGAT